VRCVLVGVLALGAGCAARSDVDPRLLGRVIISCGLTDALVFVDDQHVGSVATLRGRALAMRPGAHRIEVRREGHFAFYRDVTVAPGSRERLLVKLRRTPF
jgi:hypothetical protein